MTSTTKQMRPNGRGSTYLSVSHTSSESSCSAASTVELHSIWSITVYRSPMWRHGSTSVQPVDVFCVWDRVTVSARTAAGLLLWLARRPGTLSRIISGIRTLLQTTSSTCWKRFSSQRTSAISALDVSRQCALQIYILLTYLLTDDITSIPAGVTFFSGTRRGQTPGWILTLNRPEDTELRKDVPFGVTVLNFIIWSPLTPQNATFWPKISNFKPKC